MDCSPSGSFVRGISQARILEWDAISFSNTKEYTAISKKEVDVYIMWMVIQDLFFGGGSKNKLQSHYIQYAIIY